MVQHRPIFKLLPADGQGLLLHPLENLLQELELGDGVVELGYVLIQVADVLHHHLGLVGHIFDLLHLVVEVVENMALVQPHGEVPGVVGGVLVVGVAFILIGVGHQLLELGLQGDHIGPDVPGGGLGEVVGHRRQQALHLALYPLDALREVLFLALNIVELVQYGGKDDAYGHQQELIVEKLGREVVGHQKVGPDDRVGGDGGLPAQQVADERHQKDEQAVGDPVALDGEKGDRGDQHNQQEGNQTVHRQPEGALSGGGQG